jgi:hypothetical protein
MAKSYCDILQYMTNVSQYVWQYIAIEYYLQKTKWTQKSICMLNVDFQLINASHDACKGL